MEVKWELSHLLRGRDSVPKCLYHRYCAHRVERRHRHELLSADIAQVEVEEVVPAIMSIKV